METLLIKVSERKKANMLMELLKSMDFIESVDYMGDLKSANELFVRANEIASKSDLKDMTMDDINREIKEYRLEKDLAVIDTNILISSLIGQHSYPKKIFEELILTGKIKMCVSAEVYTEYQDVLQREKFKKYPGFANAAIALLEEIKKNCLWYQPKLKLDLLDDKDDNKFIELAVEAQAGYIITGNSNDFTIKEYQGVDICSPKEFYDNQIL